MFQPQNQPGPARWEEGSEAGGGSGAGSVRRWREQGGCASQERGDARPPVSLHATFLETQRATTILPRKPASPQSAPVLHFPKLLLTVRGRAQTQQKSVRRSHVHFYLATYGPRAQNSCPPGPRNNVGTPVWLPWMNSRIVPHITPLLNVITLQASGASASFPFSPVC